MQLRAAVRTGLRPRRVALLRAIKRRPISDCCRAVSFGSGAVSCRSIYLAHPAI
jgi:hypothetical protein